MIRDAAEVVLASLRDIPGTHGDTNTSEPEKARDTVSDTRASPPAATLSSLSDNMDIDDTDDAPFSDDYNATATATHEGWISFSSSPVASSHPFISSDAFDGSSSGNSDNTNASHKASARSNDDSSDEQHVLHQLVPSNSVFPTSSTPELRLDALFPSTPDLEDMDDGNAAGPGTQPRHSTSSSFTTDINKEWTKDDILHAFGL
ncbi:hypothetical protein BGZ95_006416 [Linnemannia exigua]|uniref:Uncharacterized protein n=1 Tax=Linnemannia exigua TaxID=604196 RepID=A0AAD4DME8_9FUNG|nr:hypothetical protein BGZ95_006416 [Linnemannia exigua]